MIKEFAIIFLILCSLILSSALAEETSSKLNGIATDTDTIQSLPPDESALFGVMIEKRENTTEFVRNAAQFASNDSIDKVLAEFNNVDGGYVDDERYLFGYDSNGTTLVQPYKKTLIGTNRINLTDVNGVELIKTQEYLAGYGGGYAFAIYPNPTKNFTDEVKYNYILPVNGLGYLGSGFFIPEINPEVDKQALSDLKNRVSAAAQQGEEEGKDSAAAICNNVNNTAIVDMRYLFAVDYNGTILAMPHQPELVGTNALNYTDRFGTPLYRLGIDIAKSGGGSEYFALYDPQAGKETLKFCYILPVEDDWLVGSCIDFWDGP